MYIYGELTGNVASHLGHHLEEIKIAAVGRDVSRMKILDDSGHSVVHKKQVRALPA